MQAWFPDPFNADTWNFAALSPWVRTYTIGIGEFPNQYHQPKYGAWAQDDWRIGNKLTLNLGLRYDLSLNSFANDLGLEYKAGQPPFYAPGRPNDTNNIQPRLGFAYQLDDRTVLRGGSGLYFSDALTVDAFWPKYNTQLLRLQYTNDGRADFAAEPAQRAAAADLRPGAVAVVQLGGAGGELRRVAGQQLRRRRALHPQRAAGNAGARRVHGDGAELELVDRLPAAVRHVIRVRGRLTSTPRAPTRRTRFPTSTSPTTRRPGVNLPFNNANRARLPWPEMGVVSMIPHNTRSGLRSLQTAFTKRLSNRWQASATYTLSWLYSAENQPFSGLHDRAVRGAAGPRQRMDARAATTSAIARCSTASGRWAVASR